MAVGLGATSLLLPIVSIPALAADAGAETDSAIRQQFGDRVTQAGRVALKLPPLAETGNSVPITVTVASPMSDADRVTRVCLFANRNPRPLVATMVFGSKAGKAVFNTNMRLSGTQDVIAIAEMADGSLWRAQMRVLVTVGACDTLQSRY